MLGMGSEGSEGFAGGGVIEGSTGVEALGDGGVDAIGPVELEALGATDGDKGAIDSVSSGAPQPEAKSQLTRSQRKRG